MMNQHVTTLLSQKNHATMELPVILHNRTASSDFNRFSGKVLKTYFKKQEPNIIMYRDYKKLSNHIFRGGIR